MKIILTQTEIEEAIQSFIQKSMTIPEGKEFVIDVSSSRGVGVTAEISIQDKTQHKVEAVVEPKKEIPFKVEEPTVVEEAPKPKKSFFANLE